MKSNQAYRNEFIFKAKFEKIWPNLALKIFVMNFLLKKT